MEIAVIDLDIGNLRSVAQALMHVAPQMEVTVTSDAGVIQNADKVVLPGQGAIGTWFKAIEQRDLLPTIRRALAEKPLLGICVGMQALFRYCEEDGGIDGLGLYDGEVRHFGKFHSSGNKPRLKIPQMGWNQVMQKREHPLWHAIDDQAHFYFLHSYCANMSPQADVIFGTADYGHEFVAAVGDQNRFAVQFHPEKSHQDGLQLLKNFTEWNGTV